MVSKKATCHRYSPKKFHFCNRKRLITKQRKKALTQIPSVDGNPMTKFYNKLTLQGETINKSKNWLQELSVESFCVERNQKLKKGFDNTETV